LAASILQLATFSPLGILSIIFVCISKREWLESQVCRNNSMHPCGVSTSSAMFHMMYS
jgi:hypothetical protein